MELELEIVLYCELNKKSQQGRRNLKYYYIFNYKYLTISNEAYFQRKCADNLTMNNKDDGLMGSWLALLGSERFLAHSYRFLVGFYLFVACFKWFWIVVTIPGSF